MIPGVEIPINPFIGDDIGTVVAAMRTVIDGPPYFMYGHRTEIASRLRELAKYKTTQEKRYPLIALRVDIPGEVVGNVKVFNSLNIGIITVTDRGYNAEERMANVIKPILYPLYYQFLRGLKTSGLFMWPKGQKFPDHVPIERFFWGVGYTGAGAGAEPGSTKELFDDPVDAIEIVNLKLNTTFKTC